MGLKHTRTLPAGITFSAVSRHLLDHLTYSQLDKYVLARSVLCKWMAVLKHTLNQYAGVVTANLRIMNQQDGNSEDTGPSGERTVRELSPDEFLSERLIRLLELMANRQSEILRLASFMDDRETEVDNAARRAREQIQDRLGSSINDDGVDELVEVFESFNTPDPTSDLSNEEREEAFIKALIDMESKLPDGHMSTYLDSVIRALRTPPSSHFLRSSLLVSLVGELEMVVNQIARAAVERQPNTLKGGDRQLTWAEISQFESIDEIRDSFVDKIIDEIFRGSLSDWMDFFAKKFKLPRILRAETFEALEVVQRRHCIVHNAGLVSAAYLSKLEKFDVTKAIDDPLVVDTKYLQNAADTLFSIAFSLVWSIGTKLCASEDVKHDFFSHLADRTYHLLQDRRYDLLKQLGKDAPIDKLKDTTSLIFKVNVWLSYKYSNDFDVVREEVVKFDTSARSRDFQLAKAALLDDVEDAKMIADSMLRDGVLSRAHYVTWPLLSKVREFDRLEQSDGDLDGTAADAIVDTVGADTPVAEVPREDTENEHP
ncbi:conserved hypothetical protein [Citricoccus sp. K5]|nr:conserved hypothetical protein [Citricoccus sp. K5]